MPTQVAPALPAPGNAAEPPQVSTEALSTEALESELVGLAGHLAAGHCRWLLLLAEFDTREAWAGPGLRSCAHWLSWRVGMSVRTGLEQLRVAHALARLPAVTEAFAAGRVSYSKVRAITRVATPSTEVVLLDLALGGTATHVERVVRLTRQATADPVAAARRELSWRWDDDGTLVLRGRFPAEQGALLVAAITSVTGGPGSPEACTCAGDGGTDDGRRSRPAGRGEAVGGGSVEGPAGHEDVCAGEPIAARRADALVTLAGGGRQVQPQVVVVLDAGSDSGEVPNEGPAARAGCSTGRGSARIQRGPALPMRTAERVGCNARVRALLRDRRGNPLYLGRTRRLASLTFHRPDGRTIPPAGTPMSGTLDELITGHVGGRIDDDTITPTWAGERLDLSGILADLLPEEAWLAAA